VTPIGVQQDGGEKIAKDAIKVVHLDADSTTTDYVLKFLGSVFIGCVGAETDGRLSRSLGHSHTAHGVERLSGHPVWNGDLRKNATGLLYRLLYINPAAHRLAGTRAPVRQKFNPSPNEAVDLVEVDPVLAAVLGDQAQLDPLRALGVQREVGGRAVIGGAQRVALARPRGGQPGCGPGPGAPR
jgi:hypothetical protein